MTSRAALCAILALVGTERGAAQQMRDFSSARQRHGETRLTTRLDFAAGTLRLAPGPAGQLYGFALTYDAERFRPASRFDPATGSVRLGLESTGRSGIRVSSPGHLEQSAHVTLSPAVALALDVTLGAVDADIELGGLRLTSLRVETGASRAAIRFSRPNTTRCASAVVEAGAAEVVFAGIGNSRCERIVFTGGVGTATLDLGGAWTNDARLDVRLTMGDLTLRLPRSVGVRVEMERFLSTFDEGGWTRDGSAYLSPGYATSRHKVAVSLATTVGNVDVEWR